MSDFMKIYSAVLELFHGRVNLIGSLQDCKSAQKQDILHAQYKCFMFLTVVG
jgi:hypothetical protein